MTTITTKKHQLPLPTMDLAFCKCRHVAGAHGDGGTGACEGVYSPYDGPYASMTPCDCSQFEAAKR